MGGGVAEGGAVADEGVRRDPKHDQLILIDHGCMLLT
jgi:hypothetical protein